MKSTSTLIKDADGTTYVKKAEGGPRRLRCPKCHNLAAPTLRTDGKKISRCTGCGTEFSSKPF